MSRLSLYSYLSIVFILAALHSLVSMSRSAPVDVYPSTIYDGTQSPVRIALTLASAS